MFDTLIDGCTASYPHGAHEWREGFLWRKRRICHGVPPVGYDHVGNPILPVHKHLYRLSSSDYYMLTFECNCGYVMDMWRDEYRRKVLTNPKVREVPGACGYLEAECKC